MVVFYDIFEWKLRLKEGKREDFKEIVKMLKCDEVRDVRESIEGIEEKMDIEMEEEKENISFSMGVSKN